MEMFASEAVNRRPSTLIVDTTEFFHRFGEGFEEWREANIIPKYNASGVTKLAFVMSLDYPGRRQDDVSHWVVPDAGARLRMARELSLTVHSK
jgi:hypothetical protein